MPRKAAVSTEDIVNALSKVDIFDDGTGRLKPKSSSVWETACELISHRMKLHALYTNVQQNRNGVLTTIKKLRGISVEPEMHSAKDCISEETDSAKTDDSDYNPHNLKKFENYPDLFFELTLEDECWRTIAPKFVVYNEKRKNDSKRDYSVLQPGWTDVIVKACWEKCRIPCAYSFKRAKIFENAQSVYLKIQAQCKECGAPFSGHCLKKPKPGCGITISIKTSDTRGVPHEKKRALKGCEREAIGKQLMHTKAIAWRREATKIMDYNDPEPAHLFGGTVLRKLRQETKDKALGLHKVSDPIQSLLHLKYSVEFAGSLKEIALDKFYCIYWSPMQYDIYKDLIKKKIPLNIDATGSVVQRLNRPTTMKSGAIFLYQAVLSSMSGILPVFQMLSEKHDANMISYWLKEWIRSGASIPSEVVTDFSLALLNGVSLAFNELNLTSYVAVCYKCLLAENETELPPCYLRVDIAHVIKLVCRWKCFSGKHSRVKDFYVRCFGIMTTCTDANQFEDMLLSVLIVALSECDDIDTKCQKRQSLLLDQIKNFTAIPNENNPDSDDESIRNCLDETDDVKDSLAARVKTIRSYAEDLAKKDDTNSGRVNPYYLPDLVVPILRMSQRFLLWTNVMVRLYNSCNNVASSSRSEAYFSDLKNSTLSDEGKPLRVDKFYVKHMRSIEGTCKIERAAIKHELDRSDDALHECVLPTPTEDDYGQETNLEISSQHVQEVGSHLKEEENWKGFNPKKKDIIDKPVKKNRGKYLKALPDVKLIHNRPLRRRQDALIQNGNLLPPVRIGETKLQLTYTCPFDSIIEILSTAYMDSASYHSAIDKNSSELLFIRIVVEYAKNGVNNFLYTERASLLLTIMNRKDNVLCCIYNVGRLLEYLLVEVPSVHEEKCCSVCSKTTATNKIPLIHVDSTLLHQKGIQTALEEVVNSSLRTRISQCAECNLHSCLSTRKPSMHIFVDVEHVYNRALAAALGYPETPEFISLQDIPHFLTICGNLYNLVGAIRYQKSVLDDGVGHYIAYCMRITGS